MKTSIYIGTKNPHKKNKLSWIVEDFFSLDNTVDLREPDETANSFLEIASEKAIDYSKQYGGYAISTDGGALIPSLKGVWDPIHTKRFANSDVKRIEKLLDLMKDKENRIIEWHEAIAVAKDGDLIFSKQEKAMDAVIDKEFNPEFYREGIWLCSISSFPNFNNRNFFELSDDEQEQTEDSWDKLKIAFQKHFESCDLGE